MLFGLSIPDIVVLVSVGIGAIAVVCGLILLFKEQRVLDPANRDRVEIELPWLGKFKANFPAAIALCVGAVLIGFPLWLSYRTPDLLPVSGKIQAHQGKTFSPLSNIIVTVVPSSYGTTTIADGSYALNIPKAGKGVAYQALLHVPNTKPPIFHLGVVQFNPEGQGKFDHTFDWGSNK